MHSLNNLWLADYAFLNRALARFDEIKASGEQDGLQRPAQKRADIVISGLLLPTVPKLLGIDIRDLGFDCTGYDEIEDQCKIAGNSKNPSVTMWVSSGGGAIQGIDRALDALRALALDKQITAHVENMSASAAYWLTTTASTIAANRLAEVGGVGVYVGLYNDPEQKTIVVRSGEFKGAGIDGYTDAQLAAIQERVDEVAGQFLTDVKAARTSIDIEEIGTGRTWGARKALAKGLIDAIVNASEPGAEPLTAESSANTGEQHMADNERLELERLRAENEALKRRMKAEDMPPEDEQEDEDEDAPIEEAPAAEGEGEAPPVEEEKKEDDEKASGDIAALRAEIKELRKAVALSRGTEPVENTGGAPSAKPRNWAEAVAFIAKRDGCSASVAGRKACAEFPNLHPARR
jgi:ClpP class serine protease